MSPHLESNVSDKLVIHTCIIQAMYKGYHLFDSKRNDAVTSWSKAAVEKRTSGHGYHITCNII